MERKAAEAQAEWEDERADIHASGSELGRYEEQQHERAALVRRAAGAAS